MATFEELAQRQDGWCDIQGCVAPHPGALNLARQISNELSVYESHSLSSEPETGAISLGWPGKSLFIFIEPDLTISCHYYTGQNLDETVFCPKNMKELFEFVDGKLAHSSIEKHKLN